MNQYYYLVGIAALMMLTPGDAGVKYETVPREITWHDLRELDRDFLRLKDSTRMVINYVDTLKNNHYDKQRD